jgi:hypothetical protein
MSKVAVIWYEDPARWFTAVTFSQVLPTEDMNLAGKLNAMTRLFIYVGVALAIVLRDSRYLFMGILALFFSAVAFEFERAKRKRTEKFLEVRDLDVVDNTVCARSTVDNPFMNMSIADIHDRPDRPKACNTAQPAVGAVIERNFNARLFRPVDDLWGNQSSQRQFYTMPATTLPNDRDRFSSWVYGRGPTCKEGNGGQCLRNMWRNLQRG